MSVLFISTSFTAQKARKSPSNSSASDLRVAYSHHRNPTTMWYGQQNHIPFSVSSFPTRYGLLVPSVDPLRETSTRLGEMNLIASFLISFGNVDSMLCEVPGEGGSHFCRTSSGSLCLDHQNICTHGEKRRTCNNPTSFSK